uniref:Uncharacterized protein n=1 Tax=Histophilus somni (strain 129Pt) TaxID=205914 RepID=Q0I3S2_HISS1
MTKLKKIKTTLALIALASSILAYATVGFLTGEQTSGMNKICYYDVLGSTRAINVSSYAVCPVTYDF